jgi:hypothetical protein
MEKTKVIKTVGPALMDNTGPGEPTKGHDSSLNVGNESLPLIRKTGRFKNKSFKIKFFIKEKNYLEEIERLKKYIASHPEPDDQYFIDIVTTAVEGGIGYWSTVYAYDCDKGWVTLRAIDEDGQPEGPKHRIKPEKLKVAWADIVTNPDLVHIQDWDDLDSSDCDNIIQVLLFGKTIYG